MISVASMISSSVPPSFDFGFEFGPAVLLVMLAVLAIGVLGTLLSVHAADSQSAEEKNPHLSLHLRRA